MTTQNKLTLFSPTTKLALASEMSDALLADITPEELREHKDEWEKLEQHRKDDVSNIQSVMVDTLENLKYMFGDGSKEVKYINNALQKGNTLVDTHYSQFTSSTEAFQMVDSAKLKVGSNQTQIGLSQTNVDELNDAIKYLTEIGYVFGRDFTAHNAINMAEQGFMENLIGKDAEQKALLEKLPSCAECEQKPRSLNPSAFAVNCGCYDTKVVSVDFKTTPPSIKLEEGV